MKLYLYKSNTNVCNEISHQSNFNLCDLSRDLQLIIVGGHPYKSIEGS